MNIHDHIHKPCCDTPTYNFFEYQFKNCAYHLALDIFMKDEAVAVLITRPYYSDAPLFENYAGIASFVFRCLLDANVNVDETSVRWYANNNRESNVKDGLSHSIYQFHLSHSNLQFSTTGIEVAKEVCYFNVPNSAPII